MRNYKCMHWLTCNSNCFSNYTFGFTDSTDKILYADGVSWSAETTITKPWKMQLQWSLAPKALIYTFGNGGCLLTNQNVKLLFLKSWPIKIVYYPFGCPPPHPPNVACLLTNENVIILFLKFIKQSKSSIFCTPGYRAVNIFLADLSDIAVTCSLAT